MRTLVGTVTEKDGMLCLLTSPGCWYPLQGSSGLAFDFRQAFGDPKRIDIGKRVYRVGDVLQMENEEQRREREASGELTKLDWLAIQNVVSNSDIEPEERIRLLDKIGAKL